MLSTFWGAKYPNTMKGDQGQALQCRRCWGKYLLGQANNIKNFIIRLKYRSCCCSSSSCLLFIQKFTWISRTNSKFKLKLEKVFFMLFSFTFWFCCFSFFFVLLQELIVRVLGVALIVQLCVCACVQYICLCICICIVYMLAAKTGKQNPPQRELLFCLC